VIGLRFQTIEIGEDVTRIADSLGSVQITWLTGVSALAVFIAGFIAARLARRSIRLAGLRTDIATPQTVKVASRIVWLAIMFYSLSASLGILGFEVLPMVSVLGIVTIVAAFGLRPLTENFSAGLTLQSLRPFNVEDQVSILGNVGTVKDVTARTVVVETVEGEVVHVPNRAVLDNPITNYTVRGMRRSSIDVGLDYATDLHRAEQVMQRAASETPGVLAHPAPSVFVHEFGDSTINAVVWFWHEPEIEVGWAVRHRVALSVKTALDRAGITIAFPQNVLWWGEPPSAGGMGAPESQSQSG
jgi:small-conductance mechanosensitive channel